MNGNQIPYVPLGYTDFKSYCSDPGAIEMIIVKSPSMPLLGAGGGYWGIPFGQVHNLVVP